jgi:hypothetical protein
LKTAFIFVPFFTPFSPFLIFRPEADALSLSCISFVSGIDEDSSNIMTNADMLFQAFCFAGGYRIGQRGNSAKSYYQNTKSWKKNLA